MKIANEVKVGILAIISLAILIIGFNYLKGKNFFKKQNTFYTIYNRVDGLLVANPVNINGLSVGAVDAIYMMQNDTAHRAVVRIVVDGNLPIPKNSVAQVVSVGFLGDKAVEIKFGNSNTLAITGDTLKTISDPGLLGMVQEQIGPIKNKSEKLMDSLSISVEEVNKFLKSGDIHHTISNLNQAIDGIQKTLKTLDKSLSGIDGIITRNNANIDNVINNASKASNDLNQVIPGINKTLDNANKMLNETNKKISSLDLNKTLNELNNTLLEAKNMISKLQTGDGTISKAINEPELYNNLNQTIKNLNTMIAKFSENKDGVPIDFHLNLRKRKD